MAELISMVEFVLTDKYTATGHKNYATFLKQPLEIWQFVPCKLINGVWVVLEEPIFEELLPMNEMDKIYEEYQQAKSLCLFEGFELDSFGYAYNGEIRIAFPSSDTIESYSDYRFKLTPTAEKQIGL